MTLYSYRAASVAGQIFQGRMEANNLADLELRLKRLELDFISGRPAKKRLPRSRAGVSRRELIQFCFHLEQLSQAGVPVIEGLNDLQDSLVHGRFREIMASMIEHIQGGKTLSQAMEVHPQVFDDVFISLIRTGEMTGNLASVLRDLYESIKWQDELSAQARTLALYPGFLALVVGAVFFFMMIYLVPRMLGFIQSLGQQPPLATRILIAISNFTQSYWQLIIGIPFVLLLMLWLGIHRATGVQQRLDRLKLATPVLGTILRNLLFARLAGTLAMMYSSGISILDAIKAAEKTVGNTLIREGLVQVGQRITDGHNVSNAFQSVGLFPPLVIRMIKVGESTGNLDKTLSNVSYFYSRDAQNAIERLQAMLEPAMTLVIGILLGWVMLAVLGPIYDTIGKIHM